MNSQEDICNPNEVIVSSASVIPQVDEVIVSSIESLEHAEIVTSPQYSVHHQSPIAVPEVNSAEYSKLVPIEGTDSTNVTETVEYFGDVGSQNTTYVQIKIPENHSIESTSSVEYRELEPIEASDTSNITETVEHYGDVGSQNTTYVQIKVPENHNIESTSSVEYRELEPIEASDTTNITETVEHYGDVGSQNTTYVQFKVPENRDVGLTNAVNSEVENGSCQVCFDKGSGYHYSAFTCEGCKGFFKRTVQRCLSYKCRGEGKCIINKVTRNNCQACRFDCCLLVGMKREAVREDRSPGGPGNKTRVKQPRLERSTDGDRPPFQDQFVKSLYEAAPYMVPPTDVSLSTVKEEHEDLSLKTFMHFGYTELRYIIDWAKKVPGFKELVIDDQMALLKCSFMELSVLRLAYRSMNEYNTVIVSEGFTVPSTIVNDSNSGTGLVLAASKFAKRLNDVSIDVTEFCILNALVLTYPDASGLQNKTKVFNLQTRIVDALRRYSLYQYPDEPYRYGKLLLRLPILRMLSAKAAEKFLTMTLDGNIPLNALVCEMMN